MFSLVSHVRLIPLSILLALVAVLATIRMRMLGSLSARQAEYPMVHTLVLRWPRGPTITLNFLACWTYFANCPWRLGMRSAKPKHSLRKKYKDSSHRLRNDALASSWFTSCALGDQT